MARPFALDKNPEDKIPKIRDQDVSVIEVDLSDIPRDVDIESLRFLIIEDTARKAWLYNKYAEAHRSRMLNMAPAIPTNLRTVDSDADHCPVEARTWNGKHYADVMDDCRYCDFDVGTITRYTDATISCAAFNAERRSEIEALVAKYESEEGS
jgi:hypothetical protein